jgi:F-type H+-transporting ATPase subunit gamma
MANIRTIKRRIRSVENVAKITNALQLVAASKMRRAQQRALQARPYSDKLREVLAKLGSVAQQPGVDVESLHPLLQEREPNKVAVLHITPDRGLAGGLPSNLNRSAGNFLVNQPGERAVIAVGKKGRDFFVRAGTPILAEFTQLGDYPTATDTSPIARIVMEDYIHGIVDVVYISYPLFVSTTVQRPVVRRILPIEPPKDHELEAGPQVDYIYEPDPREVLEQLLPRYVEMQIYDAVLESAASEQSARVVAMRNATDSANDIKRELTLTYNKARQEQITKELLDITGGAAALTG